VIVGCAYGVLAIGTYGFAAGTPTPSAATTLNGLGFTALATGVICAAAVGFASLTASRASALTVLIGWHLVASPILANISSLGEARKAILGQALIHFSPVHLAEHGAVLNSSEGLALIVIAAWLVVLLGLGAWRTRTMDA
jgi:hypothetical protein